MKNRLYLLLLLGVISSEVLSQDKTFIMEDYQWLNEKESESNIELVNTQKAEALEYFNTIEILPELENWNEEFRKQHQYKTLAFQIDAEQIGEYAERVWGKRWARASFEHLLQGIMAPPSFVSINSLDLPIEGDLFFDEVVSNPTNYDQCLIFYKRKGRRLLNALVEFDWGTKQVVEKGFQLPPAQTDAQWRDENSIYVCTNLQKPKEFGYKLRLWKRGEAIEDAEVIFETEHDKAGLKLLGRGGRLFVVEYRKAFDEIYYYLKDDKLTKLNLPNDVADMAFVSGQFVVHLRSSWKPANIQFPAGSLISIDFDKFVQGENNFTLIAASKTEQVIDNIWNTNDILIGRILEDVQSVLHEWYYTDGQWQSKRIDSPKGGNLRVTQTQKQANRYFISQSSFLESGAYVRNQDGSIVKYGEIKLYSDKDDFEVKQYFATSKDGTQIPYFLVSKKGLKKNKNNPVIMTGYGGWGRSMLGRTITPYMRWLEDGGVFVLANIRGGGEYGPDWHEAARKGNRQNAYDDFKAVTKDLIKKQLTTKGLIGATGSSNGGLLVANGFIQNPNLFGAVVIRSGSLDLALNGTGGGRGTGALGERGDPDIPEEWAYMKKISPLHNLKANKNYPPILQLASRNDDISDCAKNRKFHQRLMDLGYSDTYYIETAGGSHGSTDLANDKELELAFFYKTLHPNYENLFEN